MADLQLCTFYLNEHLLGLEVGKIQEIIKTRPMTRVPLAPGYVGGLINLRGQIVAAIDLKKRMNLPALEPSKTQMNIVIQHHEGLISLLVDSVGDIINVDTNQIEHDPHHLPDDLGKMLMGICKTDQFLLMVLDIDHII